MNRVVWLLIILGVLFMTISVMTRNEAEAKSMQKDPVGGGHPYYTEEELEIIHGDVAKQVTLSISDTNGSVYLYVADEKSEKWMGAGGQHFTDKEIEERHNGRTERQLLSITEDDGDTWVYMKARGTKGYFKAMN